MLRGWYWLGEIGSDEDKDVDGDGDEEVEGEDEGGDGIEGMEDDKDEDSEEDEEGGSESEEGPAGFVSLRTLKIADRTVVHAVRHGYMPLWLDVPHMRHLPVPYRQQA